MGRSRAGRYSAFDCKITNRSFWTTVLVRVLPVGSGKLCLPSVVNPSGETVALPYKPNTAGMRIPPERACPSA